MSTKNVPTAERLGWLLLGVVLVALIALATIEHRAPGEPLMAGEATVRLQVSSLLADGDLAYTREDFDRLLLESGANPTDLELVSASDGRRITFDRPVAHALWLLPFLAVWPATGVALAHAVLLAFLGLFAARALYSRVGTAAPLVVAVLLGASVVSSYVFVAKSDVFAFVCSAFAFCLLARAADGQGMGEGRAAALAGLLLSVPVALDPLYLVLPLAAWRQPVGRSAARNLWVGLGGGWLVQQLVRWSAGGGLFTASRFRFTPETGYPLVDFPAAEWATSVRRLAALHWDGAPRFSWGADPGLWAWDLLYLLAGRAVGLLPYFAPLLMLLLVGSLRHGRGALWASAGLWGVLVIVLYPFNLWGGPGAVGNRLFLPLYGALFAVLDAGPGAPPRPPWRRPLLVAPAVAVLALLLAHPALLRPWAPGPASTDGYVSRSAARFLPFETSQRWLPGGAVEEHAGLAVKFLEETAWVESRRGRMVVEGETWASVLLGSDGELGALGLAFGKEAPSQIELRGASLADRVLRPDGGITFRIELDGPVRRHPTWWTPRPQNLYLLSFRLPGAEEPLPFRLEPEWISEEISP
jgi:hypothetical protein